MNLSLRKLEREAGSIQPYSSVRFYLDKESNGEQCKNPLVEGKDLGMLQATLLRQYNLNFLLLSGLQKDKRQLHSFCEEKIKDVRRKTKGIEKRGKQG